MSLVRVDWPFILGFDRFAFPPLPVVVAVVVNFLDRDRGFRRDVVRQIVRSLFDFLLIWRLLETGLSFLVLGDRFSVRSNVSELLRVRLVECVDDFRWEVRWWGRGFVGHRLLRVNQHHPLIYRFVG